MTKMPQRFCFSWWQLTPGLIICWLDVLGFDVVQSYEHSQFYCTTGLQIPHFTIVAKRRSQCRATQAREHSCQAADRSRLRPQPCR